MAINPQQQALNLHESVTSGNISKLNLLLSSSGNVDPNSPDEYGVTLLMTACLHGRTQIIKTLLHFKADVEVKDNCLRTCLHYAAEGGSMDVVKFLLELNVFDVNVRDKFQSTPLLTACSRQNFDAAMIFIEHGATTDTEDALGNTCLHYSVDKYEFLEILLSQKTTNVNAVAKSSGETSLLNALRKSKIESAMLLLENGADVTIADKAKQTVLHFAYTVNLIKYLVLKGADINAADTLGITPIMKACRNGNLEVVKYFQSQGVSIHHTNNNGWTCLHYCSQTGASNTVRYLLEANDFNINSKSLQDETPLMLACQGGSTPTVELLLQYGACPDEVDGNRQTAFHHAANNGRVDTLKIILATNRVNVNLQNLEGQTPLMIACDRSTFEVAKLLLDSGADLNITDDLGMTALMYAARMGNVDAVEYILCNFTLNYEVKDNLGKTASMWACDWGQIEIIELMVRHGVNFSWISEKGSWSDLHFASTCEVEEVTSTVMNIVNATFEMIVCPDFANVRDAVGCPWIFHVLGEKLWESLLLFLLEKKEIDFCTKGNYGIPLGTVLLAAVKGKDIYEERKEDIHQLVEKIEMKRKELVSVQEVFSETDIFNHFISAVEVNADIDEIWKLIEMISSPLVLDWLIPVVSMSVFDCNPFITARLAPQVQLTMQPYTAYKHILAMRSKDGGKTLLHFAAEKAHRVVVHLLILLGIASVKDNNGCFPSDVAVNNHHLQLGDFLLQYSELNGTWPYLMYEDISYFHSRFVKSIEWLPEELLKKEVEIHSDIPEYDNAIAQINTSMKKMNLNQADRDFKEKRSEELQTHTESALKTRFPEADRVWTDGSSDPSKTHLGFGYYNEGKDEGVGYPLHPPANINQAELAAVKEVLETVASSQNKVAVLTDRQPMVETLKNLNIHSLMPYTAICSSKDFLIYWIIRFRLLFPPNPGIRYVIQWVPAHCGIDGNEIADAIAKKSGKEGRTVLLSEVKGEFLERKRKVQEALTRSREKRTKVTQQINNNKGKGKKN